MSAGQPKLESLIESTMNINTCFLGDVRDGLRAMSAAGITAQCCITSPPYWALRDYGVAGQIGSEKTPEEFIETMVEVFDLVFEVLADDGVLWLNLGDSYDNNKGMHGIPWQVALALKNRDWILRQDIIWSKPNPMPESIRDRCTKSHEYIFMMTKNPRYYYDADAIKEPAIYFDDDRKGRAKDDHKSAPDAKRNGIRPVYKDARSYDGKNSGKQRGHGRRHAGFNDRWDAMDKTEQCSAMRNKRSVWTVATQPYSEAHFATFPEKLIAPMILASSRPNDIVLDPFMGSGTVAHVAQRFGRQWTGCELNPEYIALQANRTRETGFAFV